MSRGPGRWQRELLSATSGTVVVAVSGVVKTVVPTPSRDDFTAARRAAKQLALAQRVSAVYVWGCTRCNEVQDRADLQQCCGPVRPMLAVARPGRRRLLKHLAPPPSGSCPEWVNIVPERMPQGQLPVPDVADLAALVTRRAFERLEADEARVAIRDAVAVLRLAHEIEHDDALAERDAARRQMQEWQNGLWIIRNAVVSRYGLDAWAAVSAEVRKLRPAAPR